MFEMQIFTIKSLHVAFEMWGALFCLIAMLCVYFSYMESKVEKYHLLGLLLFGGILLINDSLAWYFRGVPGNAAAFWVSFANFMTFLMVDVILAVSTSYINYLIFRDPKHAYHNWHFNTCLVLITIDICFLTLSCFFHWYYYIDDQNFYHRSYLSFMTPVLTASVLIVNFSLLLKYRKSLSKRMWICLCLCLLLPVLGAAYQYFNYGVSYANIALTIALINLFVNVMAEQGEMLRKDVVTLNDMKVQLLLSQIGPHFIYNTLSTIKHLCRTDEKQAEKTIDDFSMYLRGNLDTLSTSENVPFTQELEHVQAYLAVEKQRFGERIQTEYEIEESDFVLPTLTLLPIVENAVNHGICTKEEGGTLTIHSEKKDNAYIITVQDDGVGFPFEEMKEKHNEDYIVMTNIQERLHSVCGGSLDVHSIVGTGTTVTIRIPAERGGRA